MKACSTTSKIIALAAVILLAASTVAAQRTTRKGLSSSSRTTASTPALADTLDRADSTLLVVSGFDKPLRSGYETMFVTNTLSRPVSGIIFSVDYLDMHGRLLHKRNLKLNVDIPAGETRQLSFRTWDKQQSFFYYRSSKPRRADATPFDVVVRINKVICPIEPVK